MPVELIVPEVGESITEVEIGNWLKTEGQAVSKDEPVAEIETDKVTLELPAPATGVITKLLLAPGDAAKVGDVIGYVDENGTPSETPTNGSTQATAEQSAPQAAAEQSAAAGNGTTADRAPEAADPAPATPSTGVSPSDALVMPAAARLAEEHGIDPATLTPTGPGNRVLKEDVQRAIDDAGPTVKSAPAPANRSITPQAEPQRSAGSGTPAPSAPKLENKPPRDLSADANRREEAVPMTPLRRKIAERLVEAQHTGALLTTFNEVDMGPVMAFRKQYQDQFVKDHGIKLGFMSFFVKAAVDALQRFPAINAEIDGRSIIYKDYMDIGIAIGGGKGLVVPVLRNAERLSLAEIEQAIADYAKQAKDGSLPLEAMQGGSFTVTNGGIYGSMLSTPIVNPPQSGVLGMHNIVKRAMVTTDAKGNDSIEIKPMMYLALTYDHRLVDGREAVSFLVRVKDCIEDPARMFVEV
ncbi:MAG: 2-oxoglutarate dehydrogenase complex dihydrolipoyllysine-residue succinyltransferase [Planctomycetota bacterium]